MRAVARSCLTACLVIAAAACERPPTEPPGKNEPPPPGREFLNLELFLKDRHAIEGKWYDYDNTNHTQVPKPQAWIVRDVDGDGAPRYAAFRIKSIYADTESGVFTLAVSLFDGADWSAESDWVSSKNVKIDGRVCVDLFTGDEHPCDEDGWQLRLEYFKYFAPQSLFYVDNPGLFVRSRGESEAFGTVRIARVDDITDLSELPDPTTLDDLDDGPGESWETSDWAFDSFAPDLPESGMAVGQRFVDEGFLGRDDLYALLSFRLDLYVFTMRPTEDGDDTSGFTLEWESTEVSFEDASYDTEFTERQSATVPSPAEGEVVFMRFNVDGLVTPAADLEGSVWPHEPPATRAWDLGFTRNDGVVRVLVSPSASITNLTARDLVEE